MLTDYPYPTPFEMLRYLVRSFDFKLPAKDKKRLDDLAVKRVYDPNEFEMALKQYFSDIAQKYIGLKATERITKFISQFINYYLKNIVGQIPADGLSRESLLDILIRTIIKEQLVNFMLAHHDENGGPHPCIWFSADRGTVDAIFAWLSDHEPNWGIYLANLKKDRRDMIAAWRKGYAVPSAQSLHLLRHPDNINDKPRNTIKWDIIEPLLFFARSIDFIRKDMLGDALINESRLTLWNAESKVSLSEEIISKQACLLKTFGPTQELVAKLQSELRRSTEKSDPGQYISIINKVRTVILTSEKLQQTDYWIDWHDARWHTFSGDLQSANELYKNAFEKSLFVAGKNQKLILEEAIVVAACQPNPDKVFLKQLKWVQINFGYDIPSITNAQLSNKVSDHIEDWEIDLWISSFNSVFPKKGLFPGVKFGSPTITHGPLILPNVKEIKPDYRNPNRVIKIGETWQRAMPQLVWFALNEDVAVCKKLIEKGADVNIPSEVGDTPILMALEALNVTEFHPENQIVGVSIYRTLNDETFNLFKNIPHDVKTLNTRTQKKRLLPIISAVESGRIDVVEAVLDMGADPNGRGQTDEQTALNVCLKLIGILKNPELAKKHQVTMPITPEVLDSIRRHSSGLTGFTLEQQKQYLEQLADSGVYERIQQKSTDMMYENILRHMKIDELRKIASLLIKRGADVNAEHDSPIKGYTPLMLTVELDERELFEQMLCYGGNINKTYSDIAKKREISIVEIAKYFRSKNVIQVLNDISAYLKTK